LFQAGSEAAPPGDFVHRAGGTTTTPLVGGPHLVSRDDQWTSFSEPGKFPLVLDPVVAEVKLTKVLIDGGSGLNLIFVSTLKKMGLDFKDMLVPR
jgi:hypothetical protein